MGFWSLLLILILFYLGLTMNFEPLNLIASLVIALIIIFLLKPNAQSIKLRKLPQMSFALVRYILWLIWDLITSGIQVARLVIDPKIPIHPGVVAIPSKAQTELGEALSAHAISLTPGELVIELGEDGFLYTHCLDATHAADYLADAQKMRKELLDQIFP